MRTNPFPGMNPYLEGGDGWRNVHNSLIAFLQEQLNAVLPEGFIARTERRIYISMPGAERQPDMLVVRRPLANNVPRTATPLAANRGNTVVVVETQTLTEEAPVQIYFPLEEVEELYLNIARAGQNESIVATIEVLSPTNKQFGGDGYQQYKDKQRKILQSRSHLLEIDLLRAGSHTIAVPQSVLQAQVAVWHYVVSLHYGNRPGNFSVWTRTIRQPLPHQVTVPLVDGYDAVLLDLQAAVDRVYVAGGFERDMDYGKEPEPPFAPDDANYVDTLLREKGLRPAGQ